MFSSCIVSCRSIVPLLRDSAYSDGAVHRWSMYWIEWVAYIDFESGLFFDFHKPVKFLSITSAHTHTQTLNFKTQNERISIWNWLAKSCTSSYMECTSAISNFRIRTCDAVSVLWIFTVEIIIRMWANREEFEISTFSFILILIFGCTYESCAFNQL